MLSGLLWAGTAQAFGLWPWQWFVPNNNTEVIATIPPIEPRYNLNKILPTTKVIILSTDYDPRTAGQCIGYVKYITGVEYSGNAIEWKQYINSNTPEVGSIVVLQVGKWGHIGIILDVKDDKIVVRSRNWRSLWQISDDEFDVNDLRILGYIRY